MLEKKGVSMNVASLIGAVNPRIMQVGEDDADPTPEQLAAMQDIVRQAMEEGALGVGTSLIYVPATFAETDELVALTSTAARCGGIYMTHMRSEGKGLLEAVDETIDISRRSGAPAEIYHLKTAGREHWPKMDAALERIEAARREPEPGSRPTCTPIPRAPPGSMPPCRPGSRRAATRPGSRVCAIPRSGSGSLRRCARSRPAGRT